jgi:hypothetical protein
MAKLPRPARPLPPLQSGHFRSLSRGTTIYRVYRAGGTFPSAWNAMRTFGPTTARFDPHQDPPHDQKRAVLYAAGSLATALVEAFSATRVIERRRDDPWLAGFALAEPVRLLDLAGEWPTRAGASQAISTGRRDVARLWAQAIYEEYDVHGILYPSSMSGRRRRRDDPAMHGLAFALFDRATQALPAHPLMHLPLSHPGLDAALGEVAERYGYGLVG